MKKNSNQQFMTYKDVVSYLEKSGFDYAIKNGHSYVSYGSKSPKIEFKADWISLNPLLRYPAARVHEMVQRMKCEIRREDNKLSIVSDKDRVDAILAEMTEYGVVVDSNNDEVMFYPENGEIIFYTDIDYIITTIAEHPEKSVTDILDEMRTTAYNERHIPKIKNKG